MRPPALVDNEPELSWSAFRNSIDWGGMHPRQQFTAKRFRPALELHFVFALLSNKFGFILVGNARTLTRTIIRSRKTWITDVRPWPKSFLERTDNRSDEWLVGVVLDILFEDVDLDR